MTVVASVDDPRAIRAALVRSGSIDLNERIVRMQPLSGGVSSQILRIDLDTRSMCAKRALARLRVDTDWQVPVERNEYEYCWLQTVARINADAVPGVYGRDAESGWFAMQYLPPEQYPCWKQELREGRVDVRFAAHVGDCLGAIHAATAGRSDLAERFASDRIFDAIRLSPYLESTALAHPDLAHVIRKLIETTAQTRVALVHGDVSPKNLLVGESGPVFIDAECAWYGDPAFDLAFCLNHLLLKCVWVPQAVAALSDSYRRLYAAYRSRVTWEPVAALERRAARLLPALALARIDGKSTVEYLTATADIERVRHFARGLLT
ncbi:MAG: aminoglycoside phosphotransferase family protein, partial [Gammaproteobacteria bacterium]|nr:aminoglycoside phosphotransferase family protein [Gammaproteobacteria bacterium]